MLDRRRVSMTNFTRTGPHIGLVAVKVATNATSREGACSLQLAGVQAQTPGTQNVLLPDVPGFPSKRRGNRLKSWRRACVWLCQDAIATSHVQPARKRLVCLHE